MRTDVAVALTVAGSDSCGGAGIQADLKTMAALGVHGTCAIVAVTAQNLAGVRRIDAIPPEGVTAQLDAVFDGLPVAAIKIGMLGQREHVQAVAGWLAARPALPPVVLDPVMVATSGAVLLEPDAIDALRDQLLPLCALVTPNAAEAALLAGSDDADARLAWARQVPGAVLLKQHRVGPPVQDLLVDGDSATSFEHAPVPGGPFHGTGCTLSSAIAALLARGHGLSDAVAGGVAHVQALLSDPVSLGGPQLLLPHALPR